MAGTYKQPKQILFRIVRIGAGTHTIGFNIFFGKTFIRSFHWSRPEDAYECLENLNRLIKTYPAERELIVTKGEAKKRGLKHQWTPAPKDNIIP